MSARFCREARRRGCRSPSGRPMRFGQLEQRGPQSGCPDRLRAQRGSRRRGVQPRLDHRPHRERHSRVTLIMAWKSAASIEMSSSRFAQSRCREYSSSPRTERAPKNSPGRAGRGRRPGRSLSGAPASPSPRGRRRAGPRGRRPHRSGSPASKPRSTKRGPPPAPRPARGGQKTAPGEQRRRRSRLQAAGSGDSISSGVVRRVFMLSASLPSLLCPAYL